MSTRRSNAIVSSRVQVIVILLSVALPVFALPMANLAAHGPEIMLGSEPPVGSVVEQAPDRVIVRFGTELKTTESRLDVFDAEGRQIDAGDGGVDLNDPEHASLTVSLPALSNGTYTVRWHVVVFEDDDAVGGQFTFTVAMMKEAKMLHQGMSHDGMPMASAASPDIDTTSTQLSDDEQYRVSFTSKLEPLVINQMHSWLLHVETADGQPVDDAAITVGGGMPEHSHGLPTAPKVTQQLGNGDYLVEGLKFHMNGWWVVTLTITNGHESDSVTFNLLL